MSARTDERKTRITDQAFAADFFGSGAPSSQTAIAATGRVDGMLRVSK